MNNLQTHMKNYLEHCKNQKRLDGKTLKAYRIDLNQFQAAVPLSDISDITPEILEDFIAGLHRIYKPRTVKRKIASLRALFHYCEYKEIIIQNPFYKIQVKFREPVVLPKTIPLHTVESFLSQIPCTRQDPLPEEKYPPRYRRSRTPLCHRHADFGTVLTEKGGCEFIR